MLALCALGLGACSAVREDYVKKPSTALPPATQTAYGRYIQAEVGQHPQDSGFRLLIKSTNALMSRIALIDRARQSLDMQYYIFANDATGRLVMQHMLAAADRGVRVRLLIDDIDISHETNALDALDSHPNIEVRLFNPFYTRNPSLLSKAMQFLADASRLNRRMHNKSFIVDNEVAIIGGRNIGDDYFHVGKDMHFRDLDLIAIGPVVPEASKAFDAYWNCDAAYPVTAFRGHHGKPYDLAKLRVMLAHDARKFAQSDYAQAVIDKLPDGPSADKPGSWYWGPARLLADQPEKVTEQRDDRSLRIGPKIKAITDQAQHSLLLVAPYFIPGDEGVRYLGQLQQRGVSVQVLTNALAATDEPEVDAAYAPYRRPLLAEGVALYELRPQGAANPPSAKGRSSGTSLHAKAIVVDRRYTFIGSMNMDPRSRLLNTEMGIVVDSLPLADAVTTQFFDRAVSPDSAFRVVLLDHHDGQPGSVAWQVASGDGMLIEHHDPDTTIGRRIEAKLLGLLPIDSLL
ncbi:phospholipase D family protein [Dyella jejuensis]|uniref:Phospholipase D family protein n=2 Tax=Dyella jejuensis TaxID=1432009 RepID=A0ABW8JKB5_9GAMM